MTKTEQQVIGIAIIVNFAWAGVLFTIWMLQTPTHGNSERLSDSTLKALSSGDMNLSSQTASAPPTGRTTAANMPTIADKRKNLEAIWGSSAPTERQLQTPRADLSDRHGTTLAAPLLDGEALNATAVTLHLKDVTPREALSALGKQVGARFLAFPPEAFTDFEFAKFNYDAQNLPLMEVTNQLACKCGLSSGVSVVWPMGMPTALPAGKPLVVLGQQNESHMGPWVTSGPFSFEIQEIRHSAAIDLPSGGDIVQLNFFEQHEPQVAVVAQGVPLKITEAVDELGHSLAGDQREPASVPAQPSFLQSLIMRFRGNSGPASMRNWAPIRVVFIAQLACPKDVGRVIKRIKMTPRLLLMTKSEILEADVGHEKPAVSKTIAGLKITVQPLIFQGMQIQGTVVIDRGQQDDVQWEQLEAALSSTPPVLTAVDGRTFPAAMPTENQFTNSSMHFGYQWMLQMYRGQPIHLVPAKLVMQIPTELKAVDVPIEFDDLPLP